MIYHQILVFSDCQMQCRETLNSFNSKESLNTGISVYQLGEFELQVTEKSVQMCALFL